MKFRSNKNRPVHLGPFPLEHLKRGAMPKIGHMPPPATRFARPDDPLHLCNAMGRYQAMMDILHSGGMAALRSDIPFDPTERAQHLKAFGYFNDMAMVGICELSRQARLAYPVENPMIGEIQQVLLSKNPASLAAGIDQVIADLRESIEAPKIGIDAHTHAIVFVVDYKRDPRSDEAGTEWVQDAQAERAALLSNECAAVIANYLRVLGFDAQGHSATQSNVSLNTLAIEAGMGWPAKQGAELPWLGHRYGLAAVTTNMELTPDFPLASKAQQPASLLKASALNPKTRDHAKVKHRDPYHARDYAMGPHPFETIKRKETPTTYIDEPNVPRVPKRADMFARAQFGDMGPKLQKGATAGKYVMKSAPSSAQRRILGALMMLQDADVPDAQTAIDPAQATNALKAASYFMGIDAVGASRCPEWTWYSHDGHGTPIVPPHDQAISMVVDQGYETMEGSSGDDWIGVAQSMRAYLRFSLLGGVIAQQIRNMGYSAKAHTVVDGEVLQPPLLLLSGLGEVSRIGEVILNPFLGPRLKSGVVTTDLPLAHDAPIDFGLQKFCESCNKCARECPSGAITAGPKVMFNGYEIWKSDSQKCATYRITTVGGAMCGRCMKTCPWNLEGIFNETPFKWLAMNAPATAPILSKVDDLIGNGRINPIKKWWWDIERQPSGEFIPAADPVNKRDLQPKLKIKPEDQTMAVYPAPLAPSPEPYPFPMDREAGIAAFKDLKSPADHKALSAKGETTHLHKYTPPKDAKVLPVIVSGVNVLSDDITLYTLTDAQGAGLPQWTAGGHIDVVIAPDHLRAYSLTGDPADRSKYQIAVQREADGKGGSKLLHRIFQKGRKVFVSKPINHFAMNPDATSVTLIGGGIGITPMIPFAHDLHRAGRLFDLHYCVSNRAALALGDDLMAQPWADKVHLHISAEGTRLDLDASLKPAEPNREIYSCGPMAMMEAICAAADRKGYPADAVRQELFAVPDDLEYVNHPFQMELPNGKIINVAADEPASDALIREGYPVELKCSDGLCGVCKCTVLDGDVEHRDFVLSAKDRETQMILCQSRAAQDGGLIKIKP